MTSSQQSQIVGLALGLTTAIGCIFYEKIVLNFSFLGVVGVKFLELILLLPIAWFVMPHDVSRDLNQLKQPRIQLQILAMVATSITGLFGIY